MHQYVTHIKSARRATGSAAASVQKWIIEKDVEEQLRSMALWDRMRDEGLSQGSIELFLIYTYLTAIGWEAKFDLYEIKSLLRLDLSGCSKLESIPEDTFGGCRHLESVVFGEHRNLTN